MKKPLWKYVMIEHPVHGLEVPVIFPEGLEHKHVATLGKGRQAISAGYCEVNKESGAFEVFGESVGLNLRPRPQIDPKLLGMWFVGGPVPAAAINSPVP